jgi:hypothetical protein
MARTGRDTADFKLDLVFGRKNVAADEAGDVWVQGWASDWQTDRDDEAFAPGAFDAAPGRYLKSNPVLLWNHEIGTPLGAGRGGADRQALRAVGEGEARLGGAR